MLEHSSAAVEMYRRLTRKNLRDLAIGPCGEGMAMAPGLLSDVDYRIARIHERLGRHKLTLAAYTTSIHSRNRRAISIYPRTDVAARRRRAAVFRRD